MEQQNFLNELKASFCLRKPKSNRPTNIYMVCRIDGKQVKLSTGVKVYPEHWNKDMQEAYTSFKLSDLDNRNNEIANKRLFELTTEFKQYKMYLCNNIHLLNDSLTILKGFIYKENMTKKKSTLNATIQMHQIIDAGDTEESTNKIYRGHLNVFGRFLKDNDIPDEWENITLDTLNRFQQFLIDKKSSHTTIVNYFRTLSKVLNEADGRSDIPFDSTKSGYKYFKVIKNKTNKTRAKDKQVALTEEQVQQIYNYVPTGKDAEINEEIKDIFVLQCLVGQRIGDMDKFFIGDYRIENNVISIIQNKTKEEAIIPLLPTAKAILDKYKGGLKYIDFSNDRARKKINPIIKSIAKKIGLDHPQHYQEQKGNEVVDVTKPLYECIHTHTARHTFITIMCRLGIPKEDVIIATGHADTTMIDEVYSHLNSKDKKNKIQKAFSENLKGNSIFSIDNNDLNNEIVEAIDEQITTKDLEILKANRDSIVSTVTGVVSMMPNKGDVKDTVCIAMDMLLSMLLEGTPMDTASKILVNSFSNLYISSSPVMTGNYYIPIPKSKSDIVPKLREK